MDDVKFNAPLEPTKKERTVHVRVTGHEHAAIEKAAEDADMTVSSFFRSLLLEGAGVRPMLTSDDRLVMAALLEDMRIEEMRRRLKQLAQLGAAGGGGSGGASGVHGSASKGRGLLERRRSQRRQQTGRWRHGLQPSQREASRQSLKWRHMAAVLGSVRC
ncbi:hypothetical protein [Ensifer sp. BR816]|uniref:plasmid mobilization protein n=1 Tax=Rhizobium sp. (strain BR816) TaxID=1057002 RepID=UPI00037CAADF|nr:hypothetical protein [Ensifer sp. BR816]